MKIMKLLLFNIFLMLVLGIYLIFFSHIENISKTNYSSILDFFSSIDNIILIIEFILAIVNVILILIDVYKNRE